MAINEEKLGLIDKELESDCTIDLDNLAFELKRQSDLLHKWSKKLSIVERKWEETLRLLERTIYEKYKFYTEDFEKLLKPHEVKIYVEGDAKIIELKNTRDDLKFLINRIKGGIVALRAKGQNLNRIYSNRDKGFE